MLTDWTTKLAAVLLLLGFSGQTQAASAQKPNCHDVARKAAIALADLNSWGWERKGGQAVVHDIDALELKYDYGFDAGNVLARTEVAAKAKSAAGFTRLRYLFKSVNAADHTLQKVEVVVQQFGPDDKAFCVVTQIVSPT